MERMDKNVEQQVWQRVFAQPQPKPEQDDLRMLMLSAMEAAAAYRYLAGVLTGKAGERAKLLWEEEQASIACLRGLHRLSGGTGEKAKAMSVPKEAPEKVLERCYHRARKAMTEYTARTVDTQFGAVFRKLAEREEAHCVQIAQLLGSN